MAALTHYEWSEHYFGWTEPANVVEFWWDTFMEMPHTLRRTVATVELRMPAHSENPVFPDPQPHAVVWSLHQSVEQKGTYPEPGFDSYWADWLWRQQVPFVLGPGIVGPQALDATYQGSIYVDSEAQRHIEVDFPWGKAVVAQPATNNEQTQFLRPAPVTGTMFIRQLWWSPNPHPPQGPSRARPTQWAARLTLPDGSIVERDWFQQNGSGAWDLALPDAESLVSRRITVGTKWTVASGRRGH